MTTTTYIVPPCGTETQKPEQGPQQGENLYLCPQPHPAQLTSLPSWFADRVEIDTDRTTIPRGVWLRVTDHIVKRLQKKLSSPRTDEQQAERIESILSEIAKFQNQKEQC